MSDIVYIVKKSWRYHDKEDHEVYLFSSFKKARKKAVALVQEEYVIDTRLKEALKDLKVLVVKNDKIVSDPIDEYAFSLSFSDKPETHGFNWSVDEFSSGNWTEVKIERRKIDE